MAPPPQAECLEYGIEEMGHTRVLNALAWPRSHGKSTALRGFSHPTGPSYAFRFRIRSLMGERSTAPEPADLSCRAFFMRPSGSAACLGVAVKRWPAARARGHDQRYNDAPSSSHHAVMLRARSQDQAVSSLCRTSSPATRSAPRAFRSRLGARR
jgi:hypothetical protein